MPLLGLILLGAMVAALLAGFFRRRARPLPFHGWLGLTLLTAAQVLMFRGIEPVATYFTAIAWTCYLLIADAAVFAIRGRSRLRNEPAAFARVALLSIPLWLIFEAYNLRLANWVYVGLPESLAARWFGYAWAFATITPAIFVTADLIEAFGWWSPRTRPVRFAAATGRLFIVAGAIMLAVPLLIPRPVAAYLFGLVWLGFIFLLDPINLCRGLPSLLGELAAGRRTRLYSLLAAGWVCGWLWEFWNYWAAAKWLYIFPMFQNMKIFEMPAPGYLGFPPFALECFVMYVFASSFLPGRKAESEQPRRSPLAAGSGAKCLGWFCVPALLILLAPAGSSPALARNLELSPDARRALDLIYSGRTNEAMETIRAIQAATPESPLGYLLEAESRWWQIYCEACEIRWNTIDAWDRPRLTADDPYLEVLEKARQLAEGRLEEADTAEMRLYAGMAWMLRARLLGLRGERRATARAGVRARAHFLRCLELDPGMADAQAGLGLYNYYADTLSALAKVLRFFMGIPGGSKADGIRQLEIAIQQGELTRVGARFYLAKNLHIYDREYQRSLELMEPLVREYPGNPIFRLLLANAQSKLGRRELAAMGFRAAERLPVENPVCAAHVRELARQALAALGAAGEPSAASRTSGYGRATTPGAVASHWFRRRAPRSVDLRPRRWYQGWVSLRGASERL